MNKDKTTQSIENLAEGLDMENESMALIYFDDKNNLLRTGFFGWQQNIAAMLALAIEESLKDVGKENLFLAGVAIADIQSNGKVLETVRKLINRISL